MILPAIRTTRWLLAVVSLGSPVAAGQEDPGVVHAVFAGVLGHDVDGLWSGTRRESGTDVNVEVVGEPARSALGIELRLSVGLSANTSGDTSKVFADARWERELANGTFLAAGLGIALHDGETETSRVDRKSLGSPVLFHVPFEVGYRWSSGWSVSAYFDHVSNANLADPNQGLDTLGLRLGHVFGR